MNITKALFNNSLLRFGDFALKQQVVHYLKFYKECQWWSRERLIAYQNSALKNLMDISINEVQFYRDLYYGNGIKAGDITTIEDLHKLPPVSKADLKEYYPDRCTRSTGWPVKEYFTSGSSGTPFAVLVDNLTMSQARALMILRANYAGWELGEPVFQTGITTQRRIIKSLKDLLFNTYYASAYDLRDATLDNYLNIIDRNNINYFMGFPGSILALADRAAKVGFNRDIKGIATWGDNLYCHYRKRIELQFKCRVTDTYGCGEGIQVAAQCPDGYGYYHIFMPHVIVEIVDDDDQPVKRGEMGHILLTRLEPGAMPLIRYRIGDVGRMSPLERCKCGRGFDILEKIEGRDTDFIYTPAGNKLIVHFFTGIFEYYPEIKQFRIYQKRVEEIDIQIIPQNTIKQETLEKIKNEILERGGKTLKVNFKLVDDIENNINGKRRFVVSELKR